MSEVPEGMSEEQFKDAVNATADSFIKTINFGWDLAEIGGMTETISPYYEAILQIYASSLAKYAPEHWVLVEAQALAIEEERTQRIIDLELEASSGLFDSIIQKWTEGEVDKP